jgi:predicted RNA binding protein YcfA (HicA-like mRNA interferase family)
VKVHDLIRVVERDGWQLVRQSGSQREFWHPWKFGAVMVAGNRSETVKPGTLASVLRQAGLKGSR